VNINEARTKVEVGTNNVTNIIQQVLANGNLFLLLHLLVRKIHGRKRLVDYFQNHIMTSEEYLNIMQQKAFEKKGA
jgi:hypothetical protein